ncbi:hypothetical protein D3C71_1191420 [compost metagenome]
MISFLADSSSTTIFSRTKETMRGCEFIGCPAGIILSRTIVPFGPFILATAASNLQPMISSNSPSLPCATAMILSFTWMVLSLKIGPPGMISLMLTASLSMVSLAPIPSNVLAIPSLKACA